MPFFLWYLVRFRTEAYPRHDQYMLTFAPTANEATDQVIAYFSNRGITIHPREAYRDRPGKLSRPERFRQRRRAAQ